VGPWRVEILEWERLPLALQRDVLMLVGNLGGEWWGAGQAEFHRSWAAFEFVARLRWIGQHCRLIDELRSPVVH